MSEVFIFSAPGGENAHTGLSCGRRFIIGKYGIFKVVRLRSQGICCESCGESVGKGRVAGVGRGGKTDLKNGAKFCVWYPVPRWWGVRFFYFHLVLQTLCLSVFH